MDPNNSHTSEEEDSSGDDEKSNGRRRRFCIERKQQQSVPGGSKPKKPKLDPQQRQRLPYDGSISSSKRRRPTSDGQRQQRAITINSSTNSGYQPKKEQPTKGPVIFINPKFVKKFIEKSIKLASTSNNKQIINSSISTEQQNKDFSSAPTNTTSVKCMIEDIDFKTSPEEALKAASTMAIIRIVTECIEDDNKRDEKLNKTLVSRLIDSLSKHGEKPNDDEKPREETTSHPSNHNNNNNNNTSNNFDSEISDSSREVGSCGRPIPVIGGSVNHHFNKNVKSTYYSPMKRTHNPYQRPRRTASNIGRSSEGHTEFQKNKLKNYS